MATAATLTPEQIRRRSLQSGTIGAIVEWYEYMIYGVAAALVFGHLFFPDLAPGIGQIVSLATFGVGFPARPIGAFVAGAPRGPHRAQVHADPHPLDHDRRDRGARDPSAGAAQGASGRGREDTRARDTPGHGPVSHRDPRPEARYCAASDAAMMSP
ncbi:hypothetical protein H0H10_14020 [Streptomyces sp. TRM S81-3]|uniref:Uncharacterized protein n=1 Tax=Streptomyces griseicoloratus TaxID=2752516 RepID=A0A926L281_9ACTN|nr:hypothetical protein [Streptomyces griseicoloratus]MBD0420256.1 hypothetical protein [Streptomyces griseicoloratus]